MKVKTKLFAMCYEIVGKREMEVELPDDAVVMDVLKYIEKDHHEIAELYDVIQVAVNWEFTDPNAKLKDGDEVALIPPVTGGK